MNMRRTNRFAGTLLIAVLLSTGFAPAASADVPRSAEGWLHMLGQSFGTWWSAFTGGDGGQRGLTAAGELAPSLDPNGPELAPSLEPDGEQLTTTDEDGNELAPSIDPNG